jgi:hypothetical protein
MSGSRNRLLALGGLLLAITGAWLLVVQPINDAFAAQDETIAAASRTLSAYERRIAMRPVIEARLAQARQNEASVSGTIGGSSAELAAANIQNIVKPIIESEGGQVRSAQNLPPVAAGGFERVDVQYDASIPLAKLKAIAYRIETSKPYLFLDTIDLRSGQDITSDTQTPADLQVRWIVRGYRWTGAR